MTPIEKRKKALTAAIFSLVFVWIIAAGSINAVIALGLFVSKKWLPFFVLALSVFVVVLAKYSYRRKTPSCYRIPAVATHILFLSALIMIVINLIGVKWEPQWVKSQPYNELIPYVSTLIVYPVTFFASLWYLFIGHRAIACVHCQIRHGSHTERGLIAKLFEQESRLQLKVLLVLSAIISIVEWVYYFLFYINVNYNSPDIFFFFITPTVVTILSIGYFYTRYMGMWRHYCHNPAMVAVHGHSTAVRFIVIVNDHLLLDHYNPVIVDTPVKCFLPFTTEVSLQRAREIFTEITGVKAQHLAAAYESEDTATLANAFHFLCFFDSVSELKGSIIPAQLYSYTRVTKMIRQHVLAPELRSELERIYTVSMAWRTYHPDGRRIYPVKHYRPSFRFRDIRNYKVDYNDRRWLAVTATNEDKPFFRIRRFWNKYLNGI